MNGSCVLDQLVDQAALSSIRETETQETLCGQRCEQMHQ